MKQENFDYVQKGFRLLLGTMSGFIGQEMSTAYPKDWWAEVLRVLNNDWNLPLNGNYGELVDSLDVANCLRLIDREWGYVFKDSLSPSCRGYIRELMGVRNVVAHIGQQDLSQRETERALDTMTLLCQEMDPETAEEIREFYNTVRADAFEAKGAEQSATYVGAPQPESDSRGGTAGGMSLLSLEGTDAVQKTTLSRKVTCGGRTAIYPVYRVRLDALYYNDRNDRIATWITQYESENGDASLSGIDRDIYNRIIEGFIYESNPDAIQKTQKNISLVGQQLAGVTLTDGRVVDGNRRLTCLRRIERETGAPQYFETVIMELDIDADMKQIKLLELAVQHGEEKKVDYDLIDFAIGTYRDVKQTGLLTAEEYAAGTNEPVAEVRKRIEVADVISEFLEWIRLPGQYHVAREYQVYSLFLEMMAPLKSLKGTEKELLKEIAFRNVIMKAIPDQRKFIRDIKNLVRSGAYTGFFADQEQIGNEIDQRYAAADIRGKADIDRFAEENVALKEELLAAMEKALLSTRSQQLKDQPVERVEKSINLLLDVDSRMFSKLDPDEKANLKAGLDQLAEIVKSFQQLL